MSSHTNAPRSSLSGRIQIGHKSGLLDVEAIRLAAEAKRLAAEAICLAAEAIRIYLFSVNIKPPRHCFGFSLAWGWQYLTAIKIM
jgi:hypothetical protein